MFTSSHFNRFAALAMVTGIIVTFAADSAKAQGFPPYQPANKPAYTCSYFADTQGSYYFQGGGGGQPSVKRYIRFINVDYNGPADQQLWNRAFFEAAELYKRKNITYHMGRDGDFFTVGGLSNSRQRIVGWYDDTTGEGGYAVITHITTSNVFYTQNNGNAGKGPADPSNFLRWKLGYESGDWDAGYQLGTSIQLWKHTDTGTQAGVSFRCSGQLVR